MKIQELINLALAGDKRAAGRLMTLLENKNKRALKMIKKIKIPKRALVIGITGPTGVGKSTLINQLIREFRKDRKKIGVILCDPSSPRTGGAFLGDRIRIQAHTKDPEVFIRSLATRGAPGGISKTTPHIIKVMELLKKDIVIVETIGAGQVDTAIEKLVDILIVVLGPGAGDEIQFLKAGLMEIGDILVINKADKAGSDKTFADLREIFKEKPIYKTIATTGEGIPELVKGVYNLAKQHRA